MKTLCCIVGGSASLSERQRNLCFAIRRGSSIGIFHIRTWVDDRSTWGRCNRVPSLDKLPCFK